MNLSNLDKILQDEPKFRLKQIKEAVFGSLVNNWDEATSLPIDLREKLKKEVSLEINAQISQSAKSDSQKALITFTDGQKAETVLMRHKDGQNPAERGRNTVCVSSQVGCPLGCFFCATGKIGFKRNLESAEIVEQVLFWARYLRHCEEKVSGTFEFRVPDTFRRSNPVDGGDNLGLLRPLADSRTRNDNRIHGVVFMGMGEPFLNYENVLAAIRTLNDKNGLNIGARHISISTAGIVEGINKLADEPLQVNLALSLHAPNDRLRQALMPIAKKYPIGPILGALDEYIAKTNRRVMLEYIMIKDKNDSNDCAKELAGLVKKMKKPLVFVNLILYNPTGIFEPSSGERVKAFKAILEKGGVEAVQRWRFGDEMGGACGQLVATSD